MKKVWPPAVFVLAFALVFVTAAQTRTADTLPLKANVVFKYAGTTPCPGTPAAFDCGPITGSPLVPGLGSVTMAYFLTDFLPPGGKCDALANSFPFTLSTDVLTVAGKGEIDLSLSDAEALDSHGCSIPTGDGATVALSFAVIGGTGPYAGASGSGTLSETFGPNTGDDVYSGTLTAPGVTFDLAAPTIHGAAPKTVVARKGQKRVRLAIKVTAHDAVDGAVAAICKPKLGSLIPIGRTRVSCSATDSSANTAHAQFTYTVKKPR